MKPLRDIHSTPRNGIHRHLGLKTSISSFV